MPKLAFANAVKGTPLLVRVYDDGWRFLLVDVLENNGSVVNGVQYPATGGAASKVKLRLDDENKIYCGGNRTPVELHEMSEKEIESFHRLRSRCAGSGGKKVEPIALTPKEVALRLLAVVSD